MQIAGRAGMVFGLNERRAARSVPGTRLAPSIYPVPAVRHVLRIGASACLALFLTSASAHSDPFWGAIGGAIEGGIVGGIIGGDEGAEIGADLGAASGFVEGAIDSHERHRRYYRRRHVPRYYRAPPRSRNQPARRSYAGVSNTVAQVQVALRRLGYNPGPADGVAGARTVNAVRTYQRVNGLRATGRISTSLLRHMQARGG